MLTAGPILGHHFTGRDRSQPRERAVTATLATATLIVALAAFLPAIGPAQARAIVQRTQIEAPRPDSPLLLLVSIKKQRVRIFDVNGEITSSRISSGQPGFDTPTGVFSILEKNEHHESNIYEGAPMPHMQRLTWSGIALHAGVVPGYRASHGCIRLPAGFAKSLFGQTKIGNRVVVTPDEIEPIAFDHPKLFKPLPAETPRSAGLQPSNEATKVAINDTGPNAGELPQFLGVSPALAEAARDPNAFSPPARPRSRAEAEKAFADKKFNLQAALRDAEARKGEASENAKRAVQAVEAASQKTANANQILAPLRAAMTAAENKRKQALAAFQDFMNANASAVSKIALRADEQIEDREADLEDAILDATLEADAASTEVARRELEFATDLATAAAAEKAKETAIEAVRQNIAQLRFTQNDLIEANKETVRRSKPIAVFISLKTERIYIRQGFEPLLEAPITVSGPTRRIGTHVMTAMRYASDPNVFDWRLVSAHLPANSNDDDDDDGSRKRRRSDPSLPLSREASVRMARAALDAITIPPDIMTTISELAKPGSSLIISDRELPANENGLGTEFVVLTR